MFIRPIREFSVGHPLDGYPQFVLGWGAADRIVPAQFLAVNDFTDGDVLSLLKIELLF
jgi:hypothetical protein